MLVVGALGVVFGDIGTSPLYAMRESLLHAAHDGLTRDEVIGITSLLIWAILITVTVKYVVLIMRADNRGEGGTLALMALAQQALGRRTGVLLMLGITGAALFYGDALITPAISVLSAVEGMTVVNPNLQPYVLPVAIAILVTLFAVQSHGTAKIAILFGPVMALWFAALAVIGIVHIADDLAVLWAFNPLYGIAFLSGHGVLAFAVLGSVVLAVTGGEALYADMGHFGRHPIRVGWLTIVLPALILNYLGQGAFALKEPAAIHNLFFLMAPDWMLLPLVVLATMATVIASQAVITGAFSLTQQAIQLGLLPRLRIKHTSEQLAGQIFMPGINLMLCAGVLGLAFVFKSSSALASAYGIAVTGAMAVDTCLLLVVALMLWKWPLHVALTVTIPLFVIDMTFFAGNMLKFADGGYLPLLFGGVLILMMWTWSRGTEIVRQKYRQESVPLVEVLDMLANSKPHRVAGTAVFLTSDPERAPTALMHNLKHNRVLHKKNVLLTVRNSVEPRVQERERIFVKDLDNGVMQVVVNVGFMETPDVPAYLAAAKRKGLKLDPYQSSYFLSRLRLIPDPNSGMPLWQDRLFILLARLANDVTEYFQIPLGRVVELGRQMSV